MKTLNLVLLLGIAGAFPQARITGRVVDSDGIPIAGATVSAFERESFEAWYVRALSRSPEAVRIATAVTDDEGRYVFDVALAAGVDVVAKAPGKRAGYRIAMGGEEARTLMLRSAEPRRVRVTAAGAPVARALIADRFFVAYTDEHGLADVEEPDGGIYESALVIHRDFAIGRADPPLRENREVLDVSLVPGSPVAGRVLLGDRLTPAGNAIIFIGNMPLARSAADGSWTIAHGPPEWKEVEARSGHLVGVAVRSKTLLYDVRLLEGTTIRGSVLDAANGAAIPGAAVWLAEPGQRSPRRLTVVDSVGGFVIDAIPPGNYIIQMGHHAYAASAERLSIAAGSDFICDIAGLPFGSISGVVTDNNGAPLASAIVSRKSGGQPHVTGPDGRFFLRVPLSSRAVALTVRKKGYESTVTAPVRVVDGAMTTGIVIGLEQSDRRTP